MNEGVGMLDIKKRTRYIPGDQLRIINTNSSLDGVLVTFKGYDGDVLRVIGKLPDRLGTEHRGERYYFELVSDGQLSNE